MSNRGIKDKVAVVGMGCSKFGELFNVSREDMVMEAVKEALEDANLELKDIGLKFTRRNYENIQMKSQVLTTMLGCEKIDPRLAFAYCNLFPDPEEAYAASARYYEERQNRLAAELDAAAKAERDKSASASPPEGEDDA